MLISTLVMAIAIIAMIEGVLAFDEALDPFMRVGAAFSTVLGVVLLLVGFSWWMGWLGAPPPDLLASLRNAHR